MSGIASCLSVYLSVIYHLSIFLSYAYIMCACVYIYVYSLYIYKILHIYVYVDECKYIIVCIYIDVYAFVYVHICIYKHVYICMYTHTQILVIPNWGDIMFPTLLLTRDAAKYSIMHMVNLHNRIIWPKMLMVLRL